MNFLGKAGRLARPEECQFEVCGHEFKEQPISRTVCFSPASFGSSGSGLEKPKGWVLPGLGLSQVPMEGKGHVYSGGWLWSESHDAAWNLMG